LLIANITNRSTDQAKNRVTGPASRRENSIPSGVLMLKEFILATIIGLLSLNFEP
jgi:hypothetical protein